ncbi:MAG: AbrB/MazE/SpoVT family DNA-binding domain-containing protein [Oscillospiraceae bacterium]|nr:AbrB/MazE/SpoVT family DNA-binding domain-containing protein [Oscillospiraceae bacterium]
MKNTGVRKIVDDLGRIVIPKEIRKSLGIDIRTPVEILVEGDRMIIQRSVSTCVFCNSEDDLTEYKEKKICAKCLEGLR